MNKLTRWLLPSALSFLLAAGSALAAPPAQGPSMAGAGPPLKKENLTYEDRQAWQRIIQWPEECEAEYRRMKEAGYADQGQWLRFYEVEPQRYLVKVVCFLAAYQTNMRFYYYDETKSPPAARPLTFKIFNKSGGRLVPQQVQELGGFSEFDAAKKELVIDTKFRGLGDCGSRAVYRFSNGQAVLKEFRAKFDCDGKTWVPAQGPVIYKEK